VSPIPLPSLDEIAAAPAQAATLPANVRGALLARCAASILALAAPELLEAVKGTGHDEPADPVADLRSLSPKKAAQLLGLKETYIQELCRKGKLPAIKMGKYWIISVENLRRWKADCQSGLDNGGTVSTPSGREVGRGGPNQKKARSRSVAVGVVARRPPAEGEEVRERNAGHAPPIRRADPAIPGEELTERV